MNDPKLGAAMNAAAEKDLDDKTMKGLADLSSLRDEPTIASGNVNRPGTQLPAVPSVALIFSDSSQAREEELERTRTEIKRLEHTIGEEMKFLQELAGKIGLENDQLQALRGHLVKLNMEKAIHMAGITSNHKSL